MDGPLHCCNFGQNWHSVCFDSQPTENKESITQVEDNQDAKENNSKVSKNSAKIDENIGGAVKKKTKKQIIPNSGKIEKNRENKKLVVDLDLLDPKLFSCLQGNRSQHAFFQMANLAAKYGAWIVLQQKTFINWL